MPGTTDDAAAYYGEKVDALLTALEEATRATPEGGPAEFVPPSGGELDQVEARFHHFIWGRRGSGKTSLLRYLEGKRRAEKKVAVWIDQELFMALSYPDVLVSSVLEVVRGVRAAAIASTAAERTWRRRLWDRVFSRTDFADMLAALDRAATNLETLRQLPNDREVEWTRSAGTGSAVDALGSVKAGPIKGQVRTKVSEEHVVSQLRLLSAVRRSIWSVAWTKPGGLSRKVSGTLMAVSSSWTSSTESIGLTSPGCLGICTACSRTPVYGSRLRASDTGRRHTKVERPPQGMQPTQDANEVSLDRGLQLFDSTKQFLEQIFGNIANRAGVEIHGLMTEGALTRLVVAAGGVPRDYLRLAREAIKHARNRGPSDKQGSDKVMAEDVNSAAGQTAEPKVADLRADAPDEAAELERLLEDLGEFCRHNRVAWVAYFMVDQRDPELGKADRSATRSAVRASVVRWRDCSERGFSPPSGIAPRCGISEL